MALYVTLFEHIAKSELKSNRSKAHFEHAALTMPHLAKQLQFSIL